MVAPRAGVPDFLRDTGMWWGKLLTSYRERIAERGES